MNSVHASPVGLLGLDDFVGAASTSWLDPHLTLSDVGEIAVLFLGIFFLLRFLRRTVAGGVFRGPGLLVWVVILAFYVLVRTLHLEVLDYVLARLVPIILLALVVVFQPEFRHGLARLGDLRLFSGLLRGRGTDKPREIKAVDEVMAAVTSFAKRQTGALIAIERALDLTSYIDTGVRLDALIRAETLDTIFSTETVLHDGAVVASRRPHRRGGLPPAADREARPRAPLRHAPSRGDRAVRAVRRGGGRRLARRPARSTWPSAAS